jgi:hypothetical protein
MHACFKLNFLLSKEKIMVKIQLIKSNHNVLRKNKVDTYGAPVLHLTIAPLFQ